MYSSLCILHCRAHKALEKVDGDVTLEEFHKLSDTYAGMLTAVHPIQEKLRRRVLGIKTWEQLEHVRVSLSGGRQYAPMDQVLVLGPDAVVFPPDNNMSTQQDNRYSRLISLMAKLMKLLYMQPGAYPTFGEKD